MVKFWVGFALLIAAVAAVAHYIDGSMGMPFEVRLSERSGATADTGVTGVTGGTGISGSVARDAVTGSVRSSVRASQSRTVDEFTRIHAEGASAIEVEVREGLPRSVEIRTDENLLPAVHTDVVGGILEIVPDSGFSPRNELHIKVTAPSLAGIHLEGANKLTLAIDSRAAIELRTEGAGRIRATGRVDAVTVRGEGASSVDAGELVARSVDVRLEGAGRATVHATETLKARIEGAGIVRYAGNPSNVDKEIGGIGHISRID